MKDLIVIGGKLALVCALAALSLGAVHLYTAPIVERVQEERLLAALEKVEFGDGTIGERVSGEDLPGIYYYYPLSASGDRPYGYIVKLKGSGYSGEMGVLASYATDGTIEQVVMMENLETPGLGKKAEKDSYMEKFEGTGGESPIPTRKSMLSQKDFDEVTGASITFVGIAKALVRGSDFVKGLGGAK